MGVKGYFLNSMLSDYYVAQNDPKKFPMVARWGLMKVKGGYMFSFAPEDVSLPIRTIHVNNDMSIELRLAGRLARFPVYDKVTSFDEICKAMEEVPCLNACIGSNTASCPDVYFIKKPHSSSGRCQNCQVNYRKEHDKARKQQMRRQKKLETDLQTTKNLKQTIRRQDTKICRLENEICKLGEKMSNLSNETIQEVIDKLPEENMKEALRTWHQYGNVKHKKGMRYSRKWILECTLLRIKSRKGYLHIQNHHLLPIPALSTLNRYLSSIKPQYGFDPKIFAILKKKAEKMSIEERRGVLVLDEMQLSKGVHFMPSDLSVLGFTDLGDHTPEAQKNARGDHALVFLFQPFRGKYVQNLAAFLSKGAANGETLSHLVLECVVLMETHGFFIDAVVSDGATWNRGMWKRFGLQDEQDVSCPHPCSFADNEEIIPQEKSECGRRLWFVSDFSHLIKNLRNFIMAQEEIMTPDGIVKKMHFRAVIDGDGGKNGQGLKVAHKLTPDHIDPKYYQKMHVHKAFEVFSPNVSTAMKIYKKTDDRLQDCEPTIKFIDRIHRLIIAMTSRSPNHALAKNSTSEKNIEEFVQYICQWSEMSANNNYKFLSKNTCHGFKVTLRSTLKLMQHLTKNCNYKFLMTARLNQDALEGMFGMIRRCCGCFDKPDPLLFIYVYRLVSFYSLVKPPKGSNVDGMEIFETLFTNQDLETNTAKPRMVRVAKDEWQNVIDQIIENNSIENSLRQTNKYNANEYVQAYFAGFIARKVSQWIKCENCISSVTKKLENNERDLMINSLSKGYLMYPSDNLVDHLTSLENVILKTVGEEPLNFYTFQDIVENLKTEKIPLIGCNAHNKKITKIVMNYYMVSRTKILCKRYNSIYDEGRKKAQELRKRSKLVGNKDDKLEQQGPQSMSNKRTWTDSSDQAYVKRRIKPTNEAEDVEEF